MANSSAFSNEFISDLVKGDPTTGIYKSKKYGVVELSNEATKSLFDRIEATISLAMKTKRDHTLVLTFAPNKTIRQLYKEIGLFLRRHNDTLRVESTYNPDFSNTILEITFKTKVGSAITIKFVGLCINIYPM